MPFLENDDIPTWNLHLTLIQSWECRKIKKFAVSLQTVRMIGQLNKTWTLHLKISANFYLTELNRLSKLLIYELCVDTAKH